MGINIFMLSAIVISLLISNIDIKQKQEPIKYKVVPIITFNDSIYYELNKYRIEKIISSSQALYYKNRDELYGATIILRNDFNDTDTISADYIYNKNNLYKLYQNVNLSLNRDNNITLSSDYVEFDTLKNIIQNNREFELKYNNSILFGSSLYYSNNSKKIKALNTHFILKI
jgi:hypothetical protein